MNPAEACRHFPGVGTAGRPVETAGGHIHRTWIVPATTGRWVLQACNADVFPDLPALMHNTTLVASAVEPLLVPEPAADGSSLWRDREGVVWRMRRFVDGTMCDPVGASTGSLGELGRGLGAFHRRVAGLSGLRQHLPGFHDPRRRWAELERLGVGGLAPFRFLVDEADRLGPPAVPVRVAHFDAKADNFVLDGRGRVRALIDLDTVMPGSWLWDVGDLARSVTGTRAEDEPDGMAFDGVRFDAVVAGYLAEVGELLTASERDALGLAAAVVTFEQAVRFLADHLAGDVYYRVARPGHNLDRYRAQLALLESMTAAGLGRPDERSGPFYPRR